ncbi:MAG: tRNA pseudouridine(38-40) synthase TruA [Firmicutes bacterium]|nr:tRNA pseudouridine(38-40) synthase TruA [Bacillota bacterium]
MIKNVLMTIEYDGTGFSGWQVQPESRTVQGEIQKALKKICGQDIKIDGTSRTDAGVHALGQRASFKADFGIPVEKLAFVMNNMLPGDIKIIEAKEMPLDHHARFDAKGKEYIYKIMNCAEKDVFKRNFYYFFDKPLDVDKMREAAGCLVGTHDFASFMAMGSTPQETTVRTIYSYDVTAETNESGSKEISLIVKGDGFLYNMVRIMTGTLIEAGTGKIRPEEIADIILAKDRSRAGRTAPPQGLYLGEIYYNAEELERRG